MQVIETYSSMEQFYKYICNTPFNSAFRWERHASVENDYSFTQTISFEQAVDLMEHGWTEMSRKLTQKLKATTTPAPLRKPKNVLSVSGYQPVVPLYLAGVPTNMVDKQLVKVKSKVVTLTKSVNYSCSVNTNTIVEESIKTMQIVKKLEAQGYRCNLNITLGTSNGGTDVYCKICIKRANEKLQVSKIAFPMVHPSMLRRLFFRFIEVHPNVTKGFVGGYGRPIQFEEMRNAFPNDIILPAIYSTNVDSISSIEDLKATV